jgi:hypothetical protein
MKMTQTAQALAEAIRAKCQRDRWYGSDYYSPRRYDKVPVLDFDAFPDEEGNFPTLAVPPEQAYSFLAPDAPERTGFVYAKATNAQTTSSEQILGFALPPLLRRLYQSLANGGFGPGAGLRGIEGGYDGNSHEGTLVNLYPTEARADQLLDLAPHQREWLILPQGCWPRRMLCLVDMGCVQEACVDATTSRMYLLGVTADDRHILEPLPWTLEEWLWRWVKNEDLLERYSPGAA